MTYIVGLTGGIGSGKSTVAQFFNDLGVPIIDADIIARDIVTPGKSAFTEIVNRYGQKILKNGEINRNALRDIIFNSLEEKEWLEALLHPIIFQKIVQKISEINYPYCIVVIPLLYETFSRYKALLGNVLVVDVTEEQQLVWASQRDNCDKSLIKKMMDSQATREQRLSIANTIVTNDTTLDALKNKIKDLHQIYLDNAKK